MKLEFDKSFLKSLYKVSDSSIQNKIKDVISEIDKISAIHQIKNVKKLTGFQNYYRIKIGNYRIGFESISNSTIRFIIISHRKDIYKKFPK